MTIEANDWQGVGEQKYRVIDGEDATKTGPWLTGEEMATAIARTGTPELLDEFERVRASLAKFDGDVPLNEAATRIVRERQIADLRLPLLEPEERYVVTGIFGEQAEVIVPFRATSDEITRRARDVLHGYPPRAIHWDGWANLDVDRIDQRTFDRKKRKTKKRNYDVAYAREHVARIYLNMPHEQKEKITAAAKAAGKSVNSFVLDAVEAAIKSNR